VRKNKKSAAVGGPHGMKNQATFSAEPEKIILFRPAAPSGRDGRGPISKKQRFSKKNGLTFRRSGGSLLSVEN